MTEKRKKYLLCFGTVLCILLAFGVGMADAQKRIQADRQDAQTEKAVAVSASPTTEPFASEAPVVSSDTHTEAYGHCMEWGNAGNSSYEVYGGWVSEGSGTYHFSAYKIKTLEDSDIVTEAIPITENWAKIHYNKKTKTLRIFGTGVMFYDDFTRSLDRCEEDSDKRWMQIDFPFDQEKVKKIIVEKGVTEVSRFAFGDFTKVEEIILPDTVKVIRDFAFHGCLSLEKINIPDSVRVIGRECFGHWRTDDVKPLQELTIGKNLRKIGKGNFLGMQIQKMTVAEENPYYEVQDGVLYGIRDRKVYVGCAGITHLSIRAGTVAIGEFAFCEHRTLESVEIPDSVEKIGGGAFYECSKLKELRFGAASKCTKLERYYVPFWELGQTYAAIEYCEKLQEIRIPDGIKKLHGNFLGCKALHRIYVGKSLHPARKDKYTWLTPFEEFSGAKKRYYVVSSENPWYSGRNGKLYNKAGTTLIDAARQKKK